MLDRVKEAGGTCAQFKSVNPRVWNQHAQGLEETDNAKSSKSAKEFWTKLEQQLSYLFFSQEFMWSIWWALL